MIFTSGKAKAGIPALLYDKSVSKPAAGPIYNFRKQKASMAKYVLSGKVLVAAAPALWFLQVKKRKYELQKAHR